jgi:hypothetical protein
MAGWRSGKVGAVVGLVAVALLLGGLVAAGGCSNDGKPGGYAFNSSDHGEAGQAGAAPVVVDLNAGSANLPPDADAGGLCGNLILPVVTERPNLYFVLDRSGSMADSFSRSPYSKYVSSQIAIHDVLLSLGHRVAYGAAVFPAFASDAMCGAGEEVFATRAGDPLSYAEAGEEGPVLEALTKLLAAYAPVGNTPTSITLNALYGVLTGLAGKTRVILFTDGAPNCNEEATCEAESCTANIEQWWLPDGSACSGEFNCCAPNEYYGPASCVDTEASVTAIERLKSAKISTYVVGLPGRDYYAEVLSAMANAGGTARSGEYAYYRVEDSDELTAALRSIAVNVAISCTIDLKEPPPDWNQVNVYFDRTVVANDAKNGWKRVDEDTIELVGDSCDELLSGEVFEAQIVAGCKTVLR